MTNPTPLPKTEAELNAMFRKAARDGKAEQTLRRARIAQGLDPKTGRPTNSSK